MSYKSYTGFAIAHVVLWLGNSPFYPYVLLPLDWQLGNHAVCEELVERACVIPDSKVHVANTGPVWGWPDPGGPHVGPMKFSIWDASRTHAESSLLSILCVFWDHVRMRYGQLTHLTWYICHRIQLWQFCPRRNFNTILVTNCHDFGSWQRHLIECVAIFQINVILDAWESTILSISLYAGPHSTATDKE